MSDSTELQSLSNALASAAAAASASVVHVEGRRRHGSSGVVWAEDGVVVTADHTLERDEDLSVRLPDGRRLPATLAGRDASTDLAVLRLEATGLPKPTWDDGGTLKLGHLVLGIARPGRGPRASLGVVSVLGDAFRTPAGGRIDRWLETDLGIVIGYSGSLLVDAAGRAVGINTTGLARGLSLALPAATVRRVVESLLAHGRVRRGYLGIAAQPVRLPANLAEKASAQVGQRTALLVLSVEPGSAAEKAGLLLGDVLLSLDGQATADFGELLALLGEERVGSEASLRLLRGGEVLERPITIGAR